MLEIVGLLNSAAPVLLLGLIVWALFVIRRQRREVERNRNGSAYRSMIQRVGEGILIADADGRLLEANPVLLRKLDYSLEDLRALRVEDVLIEAADVVPLTDAEGPTTLARTAREVTQRSRDGSLVPVDVSVAPFEYDGRAAVCYIIRDATSRKEREGGLLHDREEAQRRADYLEHCDSLTGLANRRTFKDELRQALAVRRTRQKHILAMLLLDLNDFSSLNDTLGSDVGDAVLLEVARRLESFAGDRKLLARVGDDEFAMALRSAVDPDAVARAALRLQTALSAPIRCLDFDISISANIGIRLCRAGEDVETVLGQADLALAAAKANGRGSMQFFSDEMNEHVRRRLSILLSLRHALERHELTVWYQPVVDVETQQLRAFEALVRWDHPLLGVIPPAEFIPAAEQSELICPFGERVLRLVCKQVARWRKSGLATVPVAVNFSSRQFERQSVVQLVKDVLAENGLKPGDLAIEITETSLMSGAERYVAELEALRAAGVRIVVDDFGTGYSGLSYLRHLPIDALKIDRTFVANMHKDSRDASIVHAILTMAHDLGLIAVAEGVETPEQLEVLKRYGCELAQGYYFGRPMPAKKCAVLMRELARRQHFTDTVRLRVSGSS